MSNVQPRYTNIRRGKLVTFFKNGDPFFKGLQTSVSGKHFVTLSTLLSWLNDKIPLIPGIKYIFRLPDGLEISDVTQFEAGRSYVVSNVRKLNMTIKYGDPLAKHPRMFDQQAADDLNVDKGFYKSPLPDSDASLPRSRNSNHYSSDPDFGRRRADKENILAMLNKQPNTPSTLVVQEVNDLPKETPGFRRRSFAFKSGVDAESLNMKRGEDSYDELNESTLTSPSQTQKYSEYESAKEDMRDLGDRRRRSKAASLGSSAESSGSGSDKLSALDQPRNKTFLPLDAKRHERFMKKSNRLPKLNPSTNRRPFYDRHDSSSKEELDQLFMNSSRHHPSFPRIHNTSEPPKGAPYTANSFPRSAEELTRSPTGKIWSPISLKDSFQRNVKPRIIQISSNLDRKSCQRVIFNPRTLQSFEEVMKDLEGMISVPYPPVTAIYTAEEPFIKVLSLSHLTGELRYCEDFLVCGKEGVPMEIHPNFSTNMYSFDSRSNISTALKGARSEERLDSDTLSTFDRQNIQKRFQQVGHSEPSLERRLKPVNLYLNKKPISNDIQITVGCQSNNCGCRLHETLSQLLNNNNNNELNST